MSSNTPGELVVASTELSKALVADVFVFSAPISRDSAETFCERLCSIPQKALNAFLVLTTTGGDPDAAFIIARAIKRNYTKFIVGIFGQCKSAGTLIVIGADELVISDSGELGPLDIQLGKDDELFKRSSGLDLSEAIRHLRDLSWELFLHSFVKLKQGTSITTKTAAEIAHALSKGIVEPIASQIDPIRLGEVQRSLRIARDYGELLNPNFQDFKKLITGYPSHGFVIDRDQAEKIFKNVRKPSLIEERLRRALGDIALHMADNVIEHVPALPDSPPVNNNNSHGNAETNNGTVAPDGAAENQTPTARV